MLFFLFVLFCFVFEGGGLGGYPQIHCDGRYIFFNLPSVNRHSYDVCRFKEPNPQNLLSVISLYGCIALIVYCVLLCF